MRLLRVSALVAILVAALAAPCTALPAVGPPATATAPAGPDTASVIDEARAQVAAGHSAAAIAQLEAFVANHPDELVAGRLLGDLYFRLPDYARAERVWLALLATHPLDRETHNRLGALYAAQDRPGDALAEFQKSLPLRTAYEGVVAMHKRLGDLARYLATVQFAADDHPLDPDAWRELGAARHALRQNEAARDALVHVVGLRPSSCAARLDLANILVDLHNVDGAITHLNACLKVEPAYYPAVVNLGEAYLEKSEYAAARTYLERALALRPTGSEALVDIGYLSDVAGDWKTATAYYTRAMNADPTRPEAYLDLGFAYKEHKLYALAEAAFLKGIAVTDDGRLHYLLAATYLQQSKLALARNEYRHALSSDEPLVVHAAQTDLASLPAP